MKSPGPDRHGSEPFLHSGCTVHTDWHRIGGYRKNISQIAITLRTLLKLYFLHLMPSTEVQHIPKR